MCITIYFVFISAMGCYFVVRMCKLFSKNVNSHVTKDVELFINLWICLIFSDWFPPFMQNSNNGNHPQSPGDGHDAQDFPRNQGGPPLPNPPMMPPFQVSYFIFFGSTWNLLMSILKTILFCLLMNDDNNVLYTFVYVCMFDFFVISLWYQALQGVSKKVSHEKLK